MGLPAEEQSTLFLRDGAAVGWVFELYDENDAAQSLAAATRAHFRVVDQIGAGLETQLFALTTVVGLSINNTNNEITATITQAQADSLRAGEFIGELNVEFGAGVWRPSLRMHVCIRDAIAPLLA